MKENAHLRLGRSVAQTPAHDPDTNDRRVSITSMGMDIEMEDSAFLEWLEQEERYNPFQGIDGLEGYFLAGFGSTLSRQVGGAFQPVACVVARRARGQEDGDYLY